MGKTGTGKTCCAGAGQPAPSITIGGRPFPVPALEAGANEHQAREKARGLLLSTWFQDGVCPDQSPFLDHLEDVIVFARPCLSTVSAWPPY